MAYTESEESLRDEHDKLLSLCPKGWAWCVGDCDFGQDCDNCDEPLSVSMRTKVTSVEYVIFMGGPFFIAIIFSFLWCRFNNLTWQDFLNHVFVFFGIITLTICVLGYTQGGQEIGF